jgi:hypothetical protein
VLSDGGEVGVLMGRGWFLLMGRKKKSKKMQGGEKKGAKGKEWINKPILSLGYFFYLFCLKM